MSATGATQLLLIRHAPALSEGRLAGRRDVPADCGDAAALSALRRLLEPAGKVIASPALRCRQTAATLWPDLAPDLDARLWEQDFGAWEGLAHGDIPNLGALTPAALANHTPPDGESFADVCARIAPALCEIAASGERTIIIAHAGTVRAALALAIGAIAPALAFSIDPLSITRLIACGPGQWAIGGVNQRALP